MWRPKGRKAPPAVSLSHGTYSLIISTSQTMARLRTNQLERMTLVSSLTVFCGEDSRTETSQEPAGQQHPDSEHEVLLSLKERKRPFASLHDENHDSPLPETRLNEQTNKRLFCAN